MSHGNPWGKFFWNDYESDPCLRVCSLAAQGLWMRMLCLAAKADPAGYVKVGPVACTAADLAKLVGEREETVTLLLGELQRAGVYSLSRNSTIYSRRMLRDAKRSEINRKNGQKGGVASLGKDRDTSKSLKQNAERLPERPPKPQKPEARSQIDVVAADAVAKPPVPIPISLPPEGQERAVFAACGWEWGDPAHSGTATRLGMWLGAGFDLEADILPTLRRVAATPTGAKAQRAKYFDDAIRQAHAERITPIPIGAINGTHAAAARPRRPSIDDQLREIRRGQAEKLGLHVPARGTAE